MWEVFFIRVYIQMLGVIAFLKISSLSLDLSETVYLAIDDIKFFVYVTT